MLVLSRKATEKIVIGENITITVVEIRGDRIRIGIEAPKDVTVDRAEVAIARTLSDSQRNRELAFVSE
jgi:carbon storage regulator